MATAVIMPKQGQSVETCIITKWFRSKGEKVTTGDILFSYETDKAAFDLESPSDGILLEVLFEEGSEVPVLATVAVIGNAGEDTGTYAKAEEKGNMPRPAKEEAPAIKEAGPPAMAAVITAAGSRIRISPRAKKLAIDRNIDISLLSGSGPNGRIISKDIEKAGSVDKPVKQPLIAGDIAFTEQPLSNVRKIIARAMHASLQNSAQLTHHLSADVRFLLEARQTVKKRLAEGSSQQDITLNDMICWCVIKALEKYPELNSHFLDDRIRTFSRVHLGLAVDTPRGLMVPTVKDASEMDLATLSSALKSAAAACKKGSISPELLQSTAASFTVSNLGNYGVEMFTPVINLPQAAILGVCTIINRPADIGNNIIGFVPFIGLSLTYDHRAVDGGPATMFLREIKEQIEKFRY